MLRPTALLALLCLAAAAAAADAPLERGRDPFAFRAVLDERPRMLLLALGRELWVAYDAERAALYEVWPDGVDFEGAVYDWNHGPQPTSRGRVWWVSPWEEPWQVVRGGRTLAARVRWRGHRFEGGRVTLLYELELDGGARIRVAESPERVRAADGALGFTRRFVTSGVPAGAELRLHTYLRRLRAARPVETDGRFEAPPGPDGARDGVLVLRANATTDFTAWLGEPAEREAPAPAPAAAPPGLELLDGSDCRVCHDLERRTVGPAFLEIAKRYPDAEAPRLARRVILGGNRVWGEAPMSPHPTLPVADAEAMVRAILALADPDPETLEGWRRLPRWALVPLVEAVTWLYGASGPHGIDVERLLPGVHPSFDLETIRPAGFQPRVGGLGVLPDGRVAVATWDAEGAVYLLDGARVTRFAAGLLEPLGLAVVGGEIYVLQKHELTRLVDEDADGVADRYETVSDRWRCSANFHEFAFGLVHRDGAFYANLATAVQPGGASAPAQAPGRGSVVRIAERDGAVEVVSSGLRAPNGIGLGPGGRVFVTDNQGDWLPASKLLLVREGAFFGSHAVGFEGVERLPVDPPVVWLPHSEVGNSPSQPAALEFGPWRGQLVFGDVHYGGLQRVFVEEVDGVLQGAAFRFSQGFEAGVNRLAWGPDGKLYLGEIGGPGDWGQPGKLWYGLQRLAYNGRPTFELLAVRARAGGMEIEWTEPLAPGLAPAPADFRVNDWRYEPTAEYGGPKLDERELEVAAAVLSPDRRRVFLALGGLAAGRVVHLEVVGALAGASGPLWSREAWYTLNRIPR
jgi:cytochrome c